ncbi:112aa long hypothetical protein [Pyrococcus horikoshii OT3]|uniref:Uncharacterized protein n=1 Tax=Pyrococcus horikoshii (strain ATCC 700860 / DSM 12428 / JCM 9974 / NBRC 100139 / OT-3) TaxID=70601 RepID=O58450_PYRHO|nr:112aa long hypothetical protein [Pyrococcus horikoshii OT3]
MVSLRLSPFLTLLVEASANPITEPPKRCIALSKLNLVLVDGSKNNVANIFPLAYSNCPFSFISFSNLSAVERTTSISSLEKSLMLITSLPFHSIKALLHSIIRRYLKFTKNF